jgi:hypothetical protein
MINGIQLIEEDNASNGYYAVEEDTEVYKANVGEKPVTTRFRKVIP